MCVIIYATITAKLVFVDLVQADANIKQFRELDATVRFLSPEKIIPSIFTSSYASFNIPSQQSYGKSSIISGLVSKNTKFKNHIFHPIDWLSCKLRIVSHSSYGAEILTCTDADDRGYYLRESFNSIFESSDIQLELNVDSKELYDTTSTLREGREHRLRQMF